MTGQIKDEDADRLIRQFAEHTGETIIDAVKGSVAEKLAGMPLSGAGAADRQAKLDACLAKFDSMPTVDHRSADEILGYNDKGHFD